MYRSAYAPSVLAQSAEKTKPPRKLDPSRDHVLPAYEPWLHGKPETIPDWADTYLTHLARNGGLELAAHHARVHRSWVWAYRHKEPLFDEAVVTAQEFYRDSLEWRLVDQALRTFSPLGLFGRLKAERPDRWLDRSLVASLELKAEVTSDDVKGFLQHLVTHTTPTTKALLGLATPEPELSTGAGEPRARGTIGGVGSEGVG